jgi:hypothetical protein
VPAEAERELPDRYRTVGWYGIGHGSCELGLRKEQIELRARLHGIEPSTRGSLWSSTTARAAAHREYGIRPWVCLDRDGYAAADSASGNAHALNNTPSPAQRRAVRAIAARGLSDVRGGIPALATP